MNTNYKPIFNLIEIFRSSIKKNKKNKMSTTHCEQNYISDYYCDMERPFLENNKIV